MSEKELNESLSWAGKLFFAGIISYIGGKGSMPQIPLKLRMTEEQKQTMMNVIAASKKFHETVSNPNSTIEDVMLKLEMRNKMKEKFFDVFGEKWPL